MIDLHAHNFVYVETSMCAFCKLECHRVYNLSSPDIGWLSVKGGMLKSSTHQSNKTHRVGFTGFWNPVYPAQLGSLKQINLDFKARFHFLGRKQDGGELPFKKVLGKIPH